MHKIYRLPAFSKSVARRGMRSWWNHQKRWSPSKTSKLTLM